MSKVTKHIEWAGRTLTLETGVLARQADAAVLARYGDTVVLATVTSSDTPPEGINYFPLTVDYVEKWYAGGRISGSRFIKRETRPSEAAILTGRLIDRSVRPLFPKDFRNAVQIIITVLSIDQENDPDILSIIAASAALSISRVPWNGPVAPVRVGKPADGVGFVLNPSMLEYEKSALDLVVTYTDKGFLMVEAGAKEVSEDEMVQAATFGQQEVKPVLELLGQFAKEAGQEKVTYTVSHLDEALVKEVDQWAEEKIKGALFTPGSTWHESTGDELKEKMCEVFAEKAQPSDLDPIFEKAAKRIMKKSILDEKKRIDGRALNEVRPIDVTVGLLPRTHGSALFQRGDTQDVSIVTLGAPTLEQLVEGMEGAASKRFMHHYNFSTNPFCTGEVKRVGAPTRRDIGHGHLAERALEPMVPSELEFPYTIRVVSEILSADASTSMAALCGSTVALMDAGVPLKRPVAGVAMGLLADEGRFEILTDMRAVEDFLGEMDLKVAGTEQGITAMQMDVKLPYITVEIFEKGLRQAKEARLHVLGRIHSAIAEPRPQLSIYAPRISVVHIDPLKIGEIIGPGGRVIRNIIATTGAAVDVDDDGSVTITGASDEAVQKAVKWVEGITHEVEVGEEYDGPVKRILPFGAFVEILPGKEGMVHVSEMSDGYVNTPEDVVQIGQTVHVRVIKIDEMNRVNLSMKSESARSSGGDSGGGSHEFRGGRPHHGGGFRHGGGRRDRR